MVPGAKNEQKPRKKGLLSKLAGTFGGKTEVPPPQARTKTAKVAAKPEAKVQKIWSAQRLNVVEKLWGEGYVTPGGAQQVRKLLPFLQLNSKKSLLLLGAGLGGINETVVEATGVWVTGLERDRELAEIGFESMKRAGLKRQAPVRYNSLESPELKPKSFDAAVSFEGLIAVKDKKALFAAVCEALRINGELMFTALALPDANAPNEEVMAWIAGEHESAQPHPWPVEAMVALLSSLDMEVRPTEDFTREYRHWVTSGFSTMLSSLDLMQLREIGPELLSELENWTRRIKAIESGGLKAVRYHAVRPPERHRTLG